MPTTYSIVGADPDRDEVGIAVQSRFLAVGAIVPWARGGIGAAAVQAFPDVTVGPRALDRLERGDEPEAILDDLLRDDEKAPQRQIGIVAADGRAASHTGEECFPWRGSTVGPGFAVQGNVLAGPGVLEAMVDAFASTQGQLARRLLASLEAGQAAGGERRGVESAALVVRKPGGGYGGNHDRLVDLRVDHHGDPIGTLGDLLDVHDYYFGKAAPDELVRLDGAVRREVVRRLVAAGWMGSADEPLERPLQDYLGWENLEERWVGADKIDPLVLEHLRRDLADPG